MWLIYGIIAVLLLAAELVYFKIADHFNIIDKPNERSSHAKNGRYPPTQNGNIRSVLRSRYKSL